MSFYRMTDKRKRDAMIEDLVATRKRIQERNWNERLGNMNYYQAQEQHFAPLIESNAKMAKQITKGLHPIKQEVENLTRNIIKREQSDPYDYEEEEEEESLPRKRRRTLGSSNYGPLAQNMVDRITALDPDVDTSFGINFASDGRTATMGDKVVTIQGDDIIVDNEVYHGTPGLWALITGTRQNQIRGNYTQDEMSQYVKLLIQTHVLFQDLIQIPNDLVPVKVGNGKMYFRVYGR